MKRRICNLASLLSLLLFLASLAAWLGSYRAHERLGHRTRQVRYTLHLTQGRLTLTRPPPSQSPEDEARLEAECGKLSNRDLTWSEWTAPGDPRWFMDEARDGTATERLRQHPKYPGLDRPQPFGSPRPLLRALEDPDRFLAAHCLLALARLPQAQPISEGSRGIMVGQWHGAHIELLPGALRVLEFSDVTMIGHDAPETWRYNPADLPAIRDFWHDRLDETIFAMPFWPLLLPTLILPALWLRRHRRQAHRRKSGLCLACGYDLRSSGPRCSECGAARPADLSSRIPPAGV